MVRRDKAGSDHSGCFYSLSHHQVGIIPPMRRVNYILGKSSKTRCGSNPSAAPKGCHRLCNFTDRYEAKNCYTKYISICLVIDETKPLPVRPVLSVSIYSIGQYALLPGLIDLDRGVPWPWRLADVGGHAAPLQLQQAQLWLQRRRVENDGY